MDNIEYSQSVKDQVQVDREKLIRNIEVLKEAVKKDPKLTEQVEQMEIAVKGQEQVEKEREDGEESDITKLNKRVDDLLKQLQRIDEGNGEGDDDAALKTILDLETSPYSSLQDSQIENILLNHPSTTIRAILKNSPGFRKFAVALLKDKRAMPSFFKIVKKREQLSKYGMAVGLLVLLLFVWDLVGKKEKISARLFKKFLTFFIFIFGNISLFYFFFKEELEPMIRVFTKHFFS